MSDNNDGLLCALGGWGLAICAGFLAGILLMLLGDWRLIQAIFAAIVIIVLVGGFMTWVICRPLPEQGSIPRSTASTNPALSNQDSAKAAAAQAKADAGVAPPSAAEPASAPTAPAAVATKPAPAAAAALVTPSTALSGEAELSERKGSWKYNGGSANDTKTEANTDGAKPAASEPSPVTNDAGDVDYDKDGKFEGADEGTKPEGLDGPRNGQADNLKEIKGIGPKLEKLCNSMGFFHFDQISNWSADEVAWVNANLAGFKGRVTRDNWIEQAKVLAAGGETEFSKRVDDGDVY